MLLTQVRADRVGQTFHPQGLDPDRVALRDGARVASGSYHDHRDVAEARGGVGALAKDTDLNREGLYAMLSDRGNPRLSSVSSILDALGLKVEFVAKEKVKKALLK